MSRCSPAAGYQSIGSQPSNGQSRGRATLVWPAPSVPRNCRMRANCNEKGNLRQRRCQEQLRDLLCLKPNRVSPSFALSSCHSKTRYPEEPSWNLSTWFACAVSTGTIDAYCVNLAQPKVDVSDHFWLVAASLLLQAFFARC